MMNEDEIVAQILSENQEGTAAPEEVELEAGEMHVAVQPVTFAQALAHASSLLNFLEQGPEGMETPFVVQQHYDLSELYNELGTVREMNKKQSGIASFFHRA